MLIFKYLYLVFGKQSHTFSLVENWKMGSINFISSIHIAHDNKTI